MKPSQTMGIKFINGIPMYIPNSIYQGDKFYISYNDHDISTYGNVTTAIVTEGLTHFFILNGDHRENYFTLIPQGFDACFKYFQEHKNKISKYSETAYPTVIPAK